MVASAGTKSLCARCDVTTDLQQHTLHTDAFSHGLLLAAGSNVGVARDLKREVGKSSRNVTVRNGVIDLRGIGTGVHPP